MEKIMLKLAVAISFGAFALSACSSLPAVQGSIAPNQARADTVAMLEAIDPNSPVRFRSNEMNTVPGRYTLDNGSKLEVSRRAGVWLASIDGRAPVRVLPLAQGVLVARDGSIRIAFDFNDFGKASEVTVRYTLPEENRSLASR
jgi:hypothetical protein